MRRREFVALLAGAAVAWPMPLRAQEAGKSYRVAYLTLAGGQDAVIVKQRLIELGYSEGKNLIFDYRSAEGQLERLPQLAAESVSTNPDVIVTGFGTETAKAAQAATTTIPIVFTSAGDPIGAGIVKSLNRPGANITGLTSQTAEISGKRLQILEQLSPSIRIIAVIVSPGYPFTTVALPQLMTAAEARGQRLEICDNGRSTPGQCRGRGQSRRDRPHHIGNSRAARSSPANRRSRSKASTLRDLHKPGFC